MDTLIETAASLIGDSGLDTEYARGIIELIANTSGLMAADPDEMRDVVTRAIEHRIGRNEGLK